MKVARRRWWVTAQKSAAVEKVPPSISTNTFPRNGSFPGCCSAMPGWPFSVTRSPPAGVGRHAFPELGHVFDVAVPVRRRLEGRRDRLDVDAVEVTERLVGQIGDEHRSVHVLPAAVAAQVE